MYKQQFHVVGVTDEQGCSFPEEVLSVIRKGKVFSGGKRHREIVSTLLPADAEWIDITIPLEDVFVRYGVYPEIIVFASGDPLFFGFAGTLKKRLPKAEIKVYPTFNSLQLLAHRMLLPYQDMRTISLTGRAWDELDAALIRGEKLIGVLTDRQKTPSRIAERMLEYGYDNYRMTVGECLGNQQKERIQTFSLSEVIEHECTFPNNLILQQTCVRHRSLGIPDNQFELLDGREKMITKMPVRLLTLSLLDLCQKQSFWDIGFCTGSVSVEAKLQFPHLKVTAFECREAGRELIRQNSQRFGTPGIQVSIGDFMEADLTCYPAPDAVFIGGHGGRLVEMLQRIDQVLLPGGCIVFNSVSEQSLQIFKKGVESVHRRLTVQHRIVVDEFNPIEIIKAE